MEWFSSMIVAFLISAWSVWIRPSTNACSFLASSYSAFSLRSPCSLASWIRWATSGRFTLTISSSSARSFSRPSFDRYVGLLFTSGLPDGDRSGGTVSRGRDKGKNSRLRALPARLKFDRPIAYFASLRVSKSHAGSGSRASGWSRSVGERPEAALHALQGCRSGQATKTVSSPAIEPATSGQRARSSAAAIAWAEPGSVFTTTSRPASRSSTGRSREQLAEAVLAGRLGLDEARRQRVGLDPLAAGLDEPELRDVAADRRLGRPEAALAERGGQLLLGPDRALVDEVADRPLAELLHDLHGAAGLPLEEDDEDDRPRATIR